MRTGRVIAIVGMQYGSEGKGHLAYLLSSICSGAVRTGGPNAGHTIRHNGRRFKMRQIPCAFVNPASLLFIGPGGLINLDVLQDELKLLAAAGYDLTGRLYIHENVGIIGSEQLEYERQNGLRERIGSTTEGVGAATAARALRTLPIARNLANELPPAVTTLRSLEYLDLLHQMLGAGGNVMLEGTQGAELSLYHGPYPYVTSRDVSAAGLIGASALPPRLVTDVIGVVRSYPIRVAGNSGPLPYETSFEALGVPPERTTVTNNVRRIAHFDPLSFRRGCLLNGPTGIALTFTDYLPANSRDLWRRRVESLASAPVDYMGVESVEDSWKRPGSLCDEAACAWDALGASYKDLPPVDHAEAGDKDVASLAPV